MIGERTAEEVKLNIGCVFPREVKATMSVKGRSLMTGLPKMQEISSDEIIEALSEPSNAIVEAIHSVLERTPPELVGDIITNGIVLTGGGSLVYGLDKLIMQYTGINTYIADDPVTCVARGTGCALEEMNLFQDGLIKITRDSRG
jgi:rod shape-determining protein MreB